MRLVVLAKWFRRFNWHLRRPASKPPAHHPTRCRWCVNGDTSKTSGVTRCLYLKIRWFFLHTILFDLSYLNVSSTEHIDVNRQIWLPGACIGTHQIALPTKLFLIERQIKCAPAWNHFSSSWMLCRAWTYRWGSIENAPANALTGLHPQTASSSHKACQY